MNASAKAISPMNNIKKSKKNTYQKKIEVTTTLGATKLYAVIHQSIMKLWTSCNIHSRKMRFCLHLLMPKKLVAAIIQEELHCKERKSL